jgi:hypothetical protein
MRTDIHSHLQSRLRQASRQRRVDCRRQLPHHTRPSTRARTNGGVPSYVLMDLCLAGTRPRVRKRPVGFRLPNGCDESGSRRLREEWSLAWRFWRVHQSERELELGILSRHANHVALYVLRSKRATRDFPSR